MATKFEKFTGINFDGTVISNDYLVIVDGTRVGELEGFKGDWWFDDWSEGEQTYFSHGINFTEAKRCTLKYLEQIGYEPGEEVPEKP